MPNGYTQSASDAYRDFKKLTSDQQEYEQFRKLHEVHLITKGMDKKFSAKWVEKIIVVILGVFGLAVVTGLANLVVMAR